MTEPDPLRPAGAHRRPVGKHRLAVLLASLVAVAIVAVAVRFVLHDRGEPASAPMPSLHSSSRPASSSNTPSSISASIASPSASPTATPTPTPPPSTPTPKPTPTPTPAPKPALDVLNDSRITGLAAHAAAEFRAGGWSVATVSNFKGDDVPETTIYFPDAEKAAAQTLAAQFAVDRVLPAPSGLSSTHLTVVLARDWAGRG